jgi:hypothetical protein
VSPSINERRFQETVPGSFSDFNDSRVENVGIGKAVGFFEAFDSRFAAILDQTVFLTLIINLRHHLDCLVAEAFPRCYLDRWVLSQLQRLQPRRYRLKVGVLCC